MELLLEKPGWRRCYRCGFECEAKTLDCPACGRRMWSSDTIRMFGGAMTALGLILVGLAVKFLLRFEHWIELARVPGSIEGWKRGPGETSFAYAMLYLFIAIGSTAVFAGGWHIITGRRNVLVIRILLAISVVAIIIGAIARGLER